ncbi:hypothetical protein COCSUDRAFT_63365 [Coccomyxa subellipsoidea C-169]|uniref:Uncharacterized protein n=1 Tax=Coccomyxa subellipsoidea (strain C-169) TaxID=574566 RepID=I0YX53_COCSC|nr:hypothetical protein COCSUDRAFT_63365 [Coccomyxa subellipsoidea C-169]EIE22972.1 hypothetical protein COCSUDRAFT_63365 [Coccomyxa subellipsoidea C-169]|eukprot:XP_005647516.1 hypothetical protein COCSUDRAFT_63365 [Coccomyxa subellipsoidea C-169]
MLARAAVEEQTQAAEQNQRVALGSVVIESTERFPEPQKDFWEGEQWEFVGKLAITFVPLLIAAGVGVGIFAAATYNEGVEGFVKPASESAPAEIVPAQPTAAAAQQGSTLEAPPVSADAES